ncbi:hypothetical protein THAOC_12452 [Thalassiosira oceanica]|uniref:Uncharacterized protein n=1 Tax=Thalassiosira oceanica TaxID=159749 RepID=K0T021_THAOC|nr:hypothetical protein THAOC_12452 [Thalassiosira oceanica]|eukprot:EJK66621.1 hypothetical protein THAOC_12452 [Thalassiosira oceanica]
MGQVLRKLLDVFFTKKLDMLGTMLTARCYRYLSRAKPPPGRHRPREQWQNDIAFRLGPRRARGYSTNDWIEC